MGKLLENTVLQKMTGFILNEMIQCVYCSSANETMDKYCSIKYGLFSFIFTPVYKILNENACSINIWMTTKE